MSTIENLTAHAAEIASKIKRGMPITKDELRVVAIFNSLHSKKALNAGKRKVIKTGK